MTIQNEGIHPIEGVLSESNRTRSRENVTVVSGQNLPAMSVVGLITASGKYKQVQAAQVDGSQTAAGILLYAVDASAGDAKGVIIARDAEIRESALQFESTEDAGEIAAHKVVLRTLGIILRTGIA